VYEEWVDMAYMAGVIKIGGVAPLSRVVNDYYPAAYQGRRWDWVDPQKDGNANDMAIKNRTTSISQVIRDKGGDPETLFREIQRERQMMEELGITPEDVLQMQQEAPPDA
jgi:capsid protein